MTKLKTTTAIQTDDVFTRVMSTLVELVAHEGDFMMLDSLNRLDIFPDEDALYSMTGTRSHTPAQCVRLLRRCGAITSKSVYDIVANVERLALRMDRDEWLKDMPLPLKPLAFYQQEATAQRDSYLNSQKEKQFPFSVYVTGRVEYPEESGQGTYFTDGTFLLGKALTVVDALERAKDAAVSGAWNVRGEEEDCYDPWMQRDCGPVSFSERTLEIRDENNLLVVKGNACNLEWYGHVASQDEINKIETEQQGLLALARFESGWDNHETASQLRQEADKLSVGIVDKRWLNHPAVVNAVAAFQLPVTLDEEAIAFIADEEAGI